MNSFKNTIKTNFTALPNCIANDPTLSWKAKGIFLYLASKPNSWDFYMEEIKTHATDGITALKSGIKELEKHEYLTRQLRHEDGKIAGHLWILTIPDKTLSQDPLVGRKPTDKETTPYNNKDFSHKDNSKKDNKFNSSAPSETEESMKRNKPSNKNNSSGEDENNKKPSPKERTKKYIPLAKHLAKVVTSHINYNIDSRRLKSWANDLRLLHEVNKVHPKRQKKVLRWYEKNIGGDYIPEAFSGSAFREKFPKLEEAIKRQQSSPTKNNPDTAYRRKDGKKYNTDIEI